MGGEGMGDGFGFVWSKTVRDGPQKMPILKRQEGFWVRFVELSMRKFGAERAEKARVAVGEHDRNIPERPPLAVSFRGAFFRRRLHAKGPEFGGAFAGAIAGGHSHSNVIGAVTVSGDLLVVDGQLERVTREDDGNAEGLAVFVFNVRTFQVRCRFAVDPDLPRKALVAVVDLG